MEDRSRPLAPTSYANLLRQGYGGQKATEVKGLQRVNIA
jgi:hypothetical protein